MAGFTDRIGQGFAGYARDWRLAGSVNIGNHQNIGLVESAREFVPEMLRAGIAVRLKEHQQPIELADARGFQGGANLRRMMAVVVDHGNVVDRAFNVEAPTDAGKFAEVIAFVGQAKFAAQSFEFDLADDEIGLAGGAIGNDRALYVGDDGLHIRLVQAQNRCAVEGHAIDELNEGVLYVVERGVLIEM